MRDRLSRAGVMCRNTRFSLSGRTDPMRTIPSVLKIAKLRSAGQPVAGVPTWLFFVIGHEQNRLGESCIFILRSLAL